MKTTSTRRSIKKRTPYKKRNSRYVAQPRSVQLASWSKPFRTTLKYSDAVLLQTTGLTAIANYVYRANSVFDPEYTATGHQPLRFDQLAAIFNKYRVLGATITVNYSVGEVIGTTSSLGPWRVVLTPSRTNSSLPGTATDAITAAEMEGATTGALTLHESKTLYNKYHWTDLGLADISENDALVTGNPTEGFYWILTVLNEGVVSTTNIIANIDITYDVEFTNPKTIATS